MKKIIFVLAVMAGCVNGAEAQKNSVGTDTSEAKILVSAPRHFYMGNGYDLLMLSAAYYDQGLLGKKMTTPRFTAVVNLGLNFHYDLNKRSGFFTGISLKNLGFINKFKEPTGKITTTKQRVYALGVPVGIKLGDLRNRNFVFGGGEIDIPFNYRYKAYSQGERYSKYYKSNEWFSDEVASIMPYVFLGVSFDPGVIIKAQYYPANFLNENYGYVAPSGNIIKPYQGVKANIFALSLSIDIHYNQYKIQEREYRKWKTEQDKEKKN